MGGNYIAAQPATSSSLNSSPVRTNLEALFIGDLQPFRVTAQDTPDMTVAVAGDNDRGYIIGNIPLDYAGGNSAALSMPGGASEKQIALISIDSAGSITITYGTATTGSPSPPTYPSEEMVVAEIYLRQGGTVIKDTDDSTNGYVYKDRSPLLNLGSAIPAGVFAPYGGSSAPTGWLLCDGTTGKDSVADTSLAALFAAIGTTFGGSGAADFDLPDMRGRLPLGKDNMGGSSADRVTDTEADTVGSSEGDEDLEAHTHVVNCRDTAAGAVNPAGNLPSRPSSNTWSSSVANNTMDATMIANGGTATSSMSPYMTLNYIIKK